MFYFVNIIVSTIELFAGDNWLSAYNAAINVDYCFEEDYLSLDDWNNYPLNIKFLLLSWFVF